MYKTAHSLSPEHGVWIWDQLTIETFCPETYYTPYVYTFTDWNGGVISNVQEHIHEYAIKIDGPNVHVIPDFKL